MKYTESVDVSDISINIEPMYINKATVDNGKQGSNFFFGKNVSRDFFIWSYKFIIFNQLDTTLTLIDSKLIAITEIGVIYDVPYGKVGTSSNSKISIEQKSVFEASEIVALPCKSGIICGSLVFLKEKDESEVSVEIEPTSLDSVDSMAMAN